MSFDIDWNKLTADNSINESIKEFLDNQFKNIALPSYINNLSVTNFSLGDTPPEVNIRHIGDPFDEFYEDDDSSEEDSEDDSKSTPGSFERSVYGERSSSKGKDFGLEETEKEEEEEEEEARRPRDDESYNSGEDDEDEEENDNQAAENDTNELLSLAQGVQAVQLNQDEAKVMPVAAPPTLERLRTSSDSISLMLGNNTLNYLHNYNMNNIIGLGPNSSSNGTETPTDILNQNSLRMNASLLRNQPNTQNPTTSSKLTSGTKSKTKNEDDLQMILEIKYTGNLHLELAVNLLVNYPSPNFITLPIKLHITELNVHSIATVAYLKKSAFFSFLCDINDTNSDYFTSSTSSGHHPDHTPTYTGGNFVDYSSAPNNRERIDIIKKVRIESEIGEVENNVLRNVGKVEKFLIDQLRSILREEIAWPSWLCFDLSEEDKEGSNE